MRGRWQMSELLVELNFLSHTAAYSVHSSVSALVTNWNTVCENMSCVFVFQLAGTSVFAIGLWLRLDPKTKGLFEGSDSPYVFYTGKMLSS